MESVPKARQPIRPAAVLCALLVLLVVAVFGQTLGHGFINYDDPDYVYNNRLVLNGLTFEGIRHAFLERSLGLWDPLVTLSHMTACQLFGAAPGGHHLINVMLHAGSVALLFSVLRRMTGALWCSALVAAVFAIHPLRVESVAWVAERKDVLSGFFFMLSLWSYERYARAPSPKGYLTLILVFGCGLLAKVMLVTLPFVLLLLDFWPLQRLFKPQADPTAARTVNWRVIGEKLPLVMMSVAIILAILAPPAGEAANFGMETVAAGTRLQEAALAGVKYLAQLFWPADLTVIYAHPGAAALSWWPAAAALLGLISLTAFLLRNRHPALFVGWFWNLGMLLPVSGILQISRHWRADHYTYLPQIGLCMALVWTAATVTRGWPHRQTWLRGGAMLIVLLMLAASLRQTAFWRDSGTLWNHALQCDWNNPLAHNNLGGFLKLQHHNNKEAEVHFREAVRLNPAFANAHSNLGLVLEEQGKLAEAIGEYRLALKYSPASGSSHNMLAAALVKAGNTEDAILLYKKAVELDPADADAHRHLADELAGKAQARRDMSLAGEAIEHYQAAVRLKPAYSEAHHNLAFLLENTGRLDEAIEHHRAVFALLPQYVDASRSLAGALAKKGRLGEAIPLFQAVLAAEPGDARTHLSLGNALSRTGQWKDAAAHYRAAVADPHISTFTRISLAWLLATCPDDSVRNGNEAVEVALQACSTGQGRYPEVLEPLAAAYAEAGRFPEAVATAREALVLAETRSPAEVVKRLRLRILLFEAGKPVRTGN